MSDDIKKGGYFEGMKDRSPPAVDESMKPKGGSVNDKPTRDGIAKTPKTLGPRTA